MCVPSVVYMQTSQKGREVDKVNIFNSAFNKRFVIPCLWPDISATWGTGEEDSILHDQRSTNACPQECHGTLEFKVALDSLRFTFASSVLFLVVK